MITEVKFGVISGTVEKVAGHRSPNYQRISLAGVGTFSQIAGIPWMDLQAYMLQWEAGRAQVGPEGLGFRLIIDFNGAKIEEAKRNAVIHLLDSDPAPFKDKEYKLTQESFSKTDPNNRLYQIANGRIVREAHSSTNINFFAFTNTFPSQIVHTLIIAKGPFTCPAALPTEEWRSLGSVIAEEVKILGQVTGIENLGYRLEMNNGLFAQAIAHMHAHIKAGNLDTEPIT